MKEYLELLVEKNADSKNKHYQKGEEISRAIKPI